MWRDDPAEKLFPQRHTPSVEVAGSDLTRASLVERPYLDDLSRERVRGADVVLVPHEGFRDEAAVTFPTGTEELFTFLRDRAPAGVAVDAAITEGEDRELGLHFDVLTIANVLVEHAFAEAVAVLIGEWLRQHLGKRHRETEVDSSLFVQREDGSAVQIRYRGPASEYETTLRQALSHDAAALERHDE